MTDDGPDLAQFRALICEKKTEIETLMNSASDEGAPVELDQSKVGRLSRMDAIQVQAMANAAKNRRLQEIARLDAALKRIADESFGECLACGEWIVQQRLILDPGATLCIECARQ